MRALIIQSIILLLATRIASVQIGVWLVHLLVLVVDLVAIDTRILVRPVE